MEQKLLVIKYTYAVGSYVDAALYIRNGKGLILVSSDLYIPEHAWEDVKKEINAEYIDLDKQD